MFYIYNLIRLKIHTQSDQKLFLTNQVHNKSYLRLSLYQHHSAGNWHSFNYSF